MFLHREYIKSTNLSTTKRHSPYSHRPESFEDVGIVLPSGITPNADGNVSMTCPQCSHTRRKSNDPCLSVNLTKGIWHCFHCGWQDGLRRQEHGQRRPARRTSPKPARPQHPHRSSEDEAKAKAKAENDRKYLRAIWRETQPITRNDPAGKYLTRRGVYPIPVPKRLRYHSALPYYYPRHENRRPTIHPALVAAIQEPGDLVISLHRIYLTPDGYKASVPSPKKFLSPTTIIDGTAIATSMNGAAIRLDPATDNLVIAEGIETALAVRLSTGMPTWAALSATGIEKLSVPETVRCLFIAADHDPDGKGEKAAKALAQRLLREDHTKIVKIRKPQTPGTDWADSMGEA